MSLTEAKTLLGCLFCFFIVCNYFRAYIHLRFKHAVLGTHVSSISGTDIVNSLCLLLIIVI